MAKRKSSKSTNFKNDMMLKVSSNPDGESNLPSGVRTPCPPSPHLNINRPAYNLPNFNKAFEKTDFKIREGQEKSTKSEYWKKKLRKRAKGLLPIFSWLPKYNWRTDLLADVVVGITVAIFQVPQSMGYCLIAHVPPVYGLYTAFFPPLIYTFFGTSRHSAVGAFAIVSGVMTGTLVASVMEENGTPMLKFEESSTIASLTSTAFNPTNLPPTSSETIYTSTPTAIASHSILIDDLSAIEVAATASFCMGIYMLCCSFLWLGFVSIYLSEQLVSGFVTAASLYVFTSQLRYLFGLPHLEYRHGFFAIIRCYVDVVENYKDIHLPTVIVSVVAIIILLAFKCYISDYCQKKGLPIPIPIELFVVIGGTMASYYLDWKTVYNMQIVGPIKEGIPSPQIPRLSVMKMVWNKAIPLTIVGFTITLSIGKLFGAKHGYKVDANQELLALGLSNFISSRFYCIPSAASLPRSAVQESCGGKTQVASVINCVGLLAVIFLLGSLLEELPTCILASIIAVALKSLLGQFRDFSKFWKLSRLDGSIWLFEFIAIVILDIDYGLYAGLAYSLLVVIYKSQRPKSYILGCIDNSDVYVPINKYGKSIDRQGISIYQFCGPLHFANIDYFKKDLSRKTGVNYRHVISKREKELSSERKRELKQVTIVDDLKLRDSHKTDSITVMPNNEMEQNGRTLPTHVIIDCAMMSYFDSTGIKMLKTIMKEYESIGVKTFLTSCATHVIDMLKRDSFFADIPDRYVFISIHDAVLHAIDEQSLDEESVRTLSFGTVSETTFVEDYGSQRSLNKM